MLTWIVWGSLAAATNISGWVTDDEGMPVSDLAVVAYDQRFNYAVAVTGREGKYSFSDLPDNWYRIRLVPLEDQPWAEYWVPGTLDVCAATLWDRTEETVAVPDMSLSFGAQLTGRVVLPNGEPVAGAMIQAVTATDSMRTQAREARSNAQGIFELVGLPPEEGETTEWQLRIEASGVPRQYMGPAYDALAADRVSVMDAADVGDVQLLQGIQVEGVVTGPTGPVNTGVIHVYSGGQVTSRNVNADGTFSVGGLPPGDVLTWFGGDGYGFTYYPDADRPGARVPMKEEGGLLAGLTIYPPFERLFEGQFLGEGDLAGVSMLFVNDDRTVAFGADVTEDGRFVVEKLHPGEYTIQVRADEEGYQVEEVSGADNEIRWFTVPEEGVGSAEIELSPGASVSGVVMDRANDRPIYGATVVALGENAVRLGSATTDANGAYVLLGLPPGPVRLWVSYTPYCADDPNWVPLYYPEGRQILDAEFLTMDPGAPFIWNPKLGPDMEQDGMDDLWESENGLNPEVRDGEGDLDGDGISNLDEYLLGQDPNAVDGTGCGCSSSVGGSTAWGVLVVFAMTFRRRCEPTN